VRLIICGLHHQPLDIARRTGLLTTMGQNVYPDWSSALEAALEAALEVAHMSEKP
jgi:SulP family sulfate permease